MRKCFSCFKDFEGDFAVCPHCGQVIVTKPLVAIHLAPGTILAERYILGTAVGAGGFGIVYRAWDSKLETIVAVKEFFVTRLMTRAEGLKGVIVNKKSQMEFDYRKERFLAEARTMARFGAHRNIPNVFEFFEENGTAYIVMELLQGYPLNDYIEMQGGTLDTEIALMITNEVANALKSLHDQKIIHRDVAPDNIFICSGKEVRIKLMDLGAAKLADSTDDVIDIILKPGYSPAEQYDKTKNIGPWTDIYALGATLYVMLTGVKPDESTNRKINDLVIPPDQLNPAIPENLSNTIMKAMAVEKHMRFKNTTEFLAALNGEKQIMTLAKEKRRRRVRRFSGILVACIVLAITSVVVYQTFYTKKAEEDLELATITVWFSVPEGSSEEEAMKEVFDDFQTKFDKVTIEYRAIPEEEYEATLYQALEDNELPDLFESTNLPDDLLAAAIQLDNVMESDQFEECLFLDQYDKYYSNHKRMPLAIEVPVAYVITSGYTDTQYDEKYFKELSDFDSSANMSADFRYEDFLDDNFDLSGLADSSEFLNDTQNTSSVLLSSTMIINEVRSLPYDKKYVYCEASKLKCRFTYEWSIYPCQKNEQRASEVLLSWMLGNVYQRTLMVNTGTNEQIPEIPVNEECFNTKIEFLNNLEPLKKIYKHFVFVREKEDEDE